MLGPTKQPPLGFPQSLTLPSVFDFLCLSLCSIIIHQYFMCLFLCPPTGLLSRVPFQIYCMSCPSPIPYCYPTGIRHSVQPTNRLSTPSSTSRTQHELEESLVTDAQQIISFTDLQIAVFSLCRFPM